jgi:hypothetical protein
LALGLIANALIAWAIVGIPLLWGVWVRINMRYSAEPGTLLA